MANQGLFTSGPSVDDLLQKRNTRALDLQRQLMQGAAQGARDPAKAQAVSFLGSSLGRALGGAMGGGDKEMAALEAQNAAQKEAQGQYFDAASQKSSEKIFEYAKVLRDTYPEAAVKLIAIGNERRIEEEKEAKEQASITAASEAAEKEEVIRVEQEDYKRSEVLRIEGVEKQIRVQKRVQELEDQEYTREQALAKAEREEAKNSFTVKTGKEYNAENGTSLSETSMWKIKNNGDLVQIDKPTDGAKQTIPEGYNAHYDDKGNISKLEPIMGSIQYEEAQDRAAQKQADMFSEWSNESLKETTEDLINTSIDKALDIARSDSSSTFIFNTTGAVMQYVSGSERANLEAIMKPVEAEAAFSTLQAMRDASKTGGALGAINTQELEMLKNAKGALARSQSKEEFIENLTAYKETYNNIINGNQKYRDRVSAYLANKADPSASATFVFDPSNPNAPMTQAR